MIDIRVDVDELDTRHLRVTWSTGKTTWGSYHVSKPFIEEGTADVRTALEGLVGDGLNRSFANSGGFLKDLAAGGSKLCQGLFEKVTDREGGGAGDPNRIRARLKSQRDEVRLNFNVASGVHYPWGLIFDGDPASINPAIHDLSQFENFWALKYKLSSVFSGMDQDGLDMPAQGVNLRVLSVESRTVMARVRTHLDASDDSLRDSLRKINLEVIDQRQALFDKWRTVRDDVVLLHFYCHADGTQLALGPRTDDTIRVSSFRNELRRVTGDNFTPCLLFMNGCQTAIGHQIQDGFLEVTGSAGYCGFIGTETKIPDVFALRFGMAFLHNFLKGAPVFEVMDSLRRLHWPLGIVYSTYCYPTLRVASAASLSVLQNVNYCTLSLGTEAI